MTEQEVLEVESAAVNETAGFCPALAAQTILFVEDETFVREVTGEILRAAGYRVLTATNAATAARTYDLEGGDVDLLLTDVVLPGESGRELAARLKRARPALKVLMITGYAEHMRWREAWPGPCLAKPFSVEVLLKRIRKALDCDGMMASRVI